MSVFVYVCVYLVHLLPVCDASDRGHNPEPQTATEVVPEGGRRQLEGEDGRNTLQSWSDDTATQSLSTLCLPLLIISQRSAVQMGGYTTSITHSKSK